MKPDLYTKTILTVIAGCLLWLCVNSVTPAASAQTAQPPAPTRVLLVDERNVPIPTAQGLRVSVGAQTVPLSVSVMNPSLNVAVSNPSFAVALTAIERRGSWQPLDVRVMREPPTLQPTP